MSGEMPTTKTCPSCGKDVRADANFCKYCSNQFDEDDEGTGDDDDGSESSVELSECPDCGADLSRIPSDRLSSCPICSTDLSDIIAESQEPEVTPADLDECPDCGQDLSTIPENMRLVCPNCRVDLEEAIEAHVETGGGDEEEVPEDSPLNDDVDTIKGIASGYADRLADAGVHTVGDLVSADPGQLSDETDISRKRIKQWIDDAPTDAEPDEEEEPADVEPVDPSDQHPTTDVGPAGANEGTGADVEPIDPGAEPDPEPGGGGQGSIEPEPRSQGQSQGRGGGGGPEPRDQPQGQSRGQGQGRGGGPEPRDQPQGQGRGQGQSQGRGGGGGPEPRDQGGGIEPEPRDQGQGRGGQPEPEPQEDGVEMDTRIQGPAEEVVFDVMGREIRASDGDTVGRGIRTAMVEGGASENEAVYIHREHARVDKERGGFYLTRIGENSLKVNGEVIEKGQRVRLTHGDTVAFAEVVSAEVRIE